LLRSGAVPPQNELAELAVADPRHQEEHVRLIARGPVNLAPTRRAGLGRLSPH
jgi:hypothetical protein